MLVTRDGDYLFIINDEGGLKQWSVEAKTLVQDFGNLGHKNFSIYD
jgi:hypothetical protein